MRNAAAARFELRLVLLERILPPDFLVPGHKASHEVKCFSDFQGVMSKPTSPASVNNVSAPRPAMLKRSTPVSLNNWVRISISARTQFLAWKRFCDAGGKSSVRIGWLLRRAAIAASHSAILA